MSRTQQLVRHSAHLLTIDTVFHTVKHRLRFFNIRARRHRHSEGVAIIGLPISLAIPPRGSAAEAPVHPKPTPVMRFSLARSELSPTVLPSTAHCLLHHRS